MTRDAKLNPEGHTQALAGRVCKSIFYCEWAGLTRVRRLPELLEQGKIRLDGRHRQFRDFGFVVPMAQGDCFLCKGSGEEGFHLGVRHGAALQFEAEDGRWRESLQVGRVGGAKITLGGDVQADGRCDGLRQMRGEECVREFFVVRVLALLGDVFAFLVEQVAYVMQQGGGDQGIGAVRFAGEVGGLQAVFEDGYGFAEVGFMAAAGEKIEDRFGSVELCLLIRH
jgi:hypothetical protein